MTGDRSDHFAIVRRLCDRAVADAVVPGAVVLIADGGDVRFCEAFGQRQLEPHRLPALVDTVYDLASLTKAVVTSVLAMRAVQAAVVGLDDPVARHLPEILAADPDGTVDPRRGSITVRHLLAHASGLPAHRRFYEQIERSPSARFAIEQASAREPLAYPPGSRSLYSDLGFVLLGWLLERTAGVRLDAQAAALFARLPPPPLSAGFVNLADTDARAGLLATRSVAATERCPSRGHVVLGEVHDLNARAMGGIAGHAGLFGCAADLDRVARALVSAWSGADGAAQGGAPGLGIARDVVREFWRPAGVPGSTWRLGWDGPAAQGSQAGARLSRAAVGHLGYTGCSLWIDPERARWIVLLTNRVHPVARDDDRFRAFRPALHDAAVDALDSARAP